MKNKWDMRLWKFRWRASGTLMCLLIWVFFLPYVSWGGIPTVTSITPDTGTAYSPQNVVISGSNFEQGATVSLLNGQPSLAGSYNTPGVASGVYVSGSYAYVADEVSGLQVIDISNPGAPTLMGSYNTPGQAYSVYVSGNYAYVADGSLGLQVIDISNPGAPTLTGSYSINLPCLEGCWADSVHVSGNYAYLTVAGPGLLQVIDISNPAAPVLTSSYSTSGGGVSGVYVSGNYAYVVVGSGLKVINISNPATPTLAGSYNTPGGAVGVYVSGNYAYVADWFSGLQVIDISNPATPILTGSYNTPDAASGVYVSGNYAYVADRSSGLQVIDISNPAAPAFAGSYDTPDMASGIYVSDSYAYIADRDSGLQVIRISDPATNISVVDSNTITATFPAGLSEGPYHVLVTNPGGEDGILYNGYTVVNPTNEVCDGIDNDLDGQIDEDFPVGNTSCGTDVQVISNNVTLAFSSVTMSGDTTIITSGTGGPTPSGFKLEPLPIYYNITTTATFTGSVQICITYNETEFSTEGSLKLFHLPSENNQWVDVTTSLDTTTNVVCGQSTTLSVWGMGEPSDSDGDTVPDISDNCPIANPLQEDSDLDGVGDACDLTPKHDLLLKKVTAPRAVNVRVGRKPAKANITVQVQNLLKPKKDGSHTENVQVSLNLSGSLPGGCSMTLPQGNTKTGSVRPRQTRSFKFKTVFQCPAEAVIGEIPFTAEAVVVHNPTTEQELNPINNTGNRSFTVRVRN